MDRTTDAVIRQINGMGSEVFEIGLFKPAAEPGEPVMLPRTWDPDTLIRSIPWLRHQNRDSRNIYIRPGGEHNLSLVDDLTRQSVTDMKRAGFDPAVVVETSPGNYQAWVKHPEALPKEISTAAAQALATNFGGDPGAADWRHFGRLGGFTNRKDRHRDGATGLFPFVRLIEVTGRSYPEAPRFLDELHRSVERTRRDRAATTVAPSSGPLPLKTIDEFRARSKYTGDQTRVDLAYALYALSKGAAESDVRSAIGNRDLSHKGNERRQEEYVDRTIRKAASLIQPRGR
jgi:hypothetical protein